MASVEQSTKQLSPNARMVTGAVINLRDPNLRAKREAVADLNRALSAGD